MQFWENPHSWVFQRPQIALVLRTRAILRFLKNSLTSTTGHQDQENKSVEGAERHEKGVEIQHEERRENIILSIYFHIVRAPLGIWIMELDTHTREVARSTCMLGRQVPSPSSTVRWKQRAGHCRRNTELLLRLPKSYSGSRHTHVFLQKRCHSKKQKMSFVGVWRRILASFIPFFYSLHLVNDLKHSSWITIKDSTRAKID